MAPLTRPHISLWKIRRRLSIHLAVINMDVNSLGDVTSMSPGTRHTLYNLMLHYDACDLWKSFLHKHRSFPFFMQTYYSSYFTFSYLTWDANKSVSWRNHFIKFWLGCLCLAYRGVAWFDLSFLFVLFFLKVIGLLKDASYGSLSQNNVQEQKCKLYI